MKQMLSRKPRAGAVPSTNHPRQLVHRRNLAQHQGPTAAVTKQLRPSQRFQVLAATIAAGACVEKEAGWVTAGSSTRRGALDTIVVPLDYYR